MSEIYQLLSKHFLGETTSEEERQIAEFKVQHRKEYDALSQVWKKEGLVIKDYDSQKAWNKIKAQKAKAPAKLVPMYRRVLKLAAVAVVLLITVFLTKDFFIPKSTEMMVAEATFTERGKKIELTDGSVVYLNKNAQLFYPSGFNGKERKVELKGEAFFEIAKDAARPFIITTNHASVQVLGTSFNVNAGATQNEISVKTGKVKVRTTTGEKSVVLTAGHSAIAFSSELQSFETSDPNYLSWKTGEFKFEATPIAKVIEDLSSFYNNRIRISNESAECEFTGSFNNSTLSDIVEILKISCELKSSETNESYELY